MQPTQALASRPPVESALKPDLLSIAQVVTQVKHQRTTQSKDMMNHKKDERKK